MTQLIPQIIAPLDGVSTSASDVQERYGYRWVSIATFGHAPAAPSEVRVVYRSPDRREATIYEAIAEPVRIDQPPIDLGEIFYVIEGSVTRTARDGSRTVWRSGDIVRHSYADGADLAYGGGTRLVRFLWSDSHLPDGVGEVTRAPYPPGPMSTPPQDTGWFSLNIHDDLSHWPVTYHDRATFNAPILESADKRRSALYGVLPDGAAFDDPVSNARESFFITQGTIEITPQGGETITWTAGDLVYWPYEIEQKNVYGKGLGCLCYFWSHTDLPDYVGGASTQAISPSR